MAIKNGVNYKMKRRMSLESDQYYLKTPKEMTELFSHVPEALENTLKIAEACNVDD